VIAIEDGAQRTLVNLDHVAFCAEDAGSTTLSYLGLSGGHVLAVQEDVERLRDRIINSVFSPEP
jgi:hypothetical protein